MKIRAITLFNLDRLFSLIALSNSAKSDEAILKPGVRAASLNPSESPFISKERRLPLSAVIYSQTGAYNYRRIGGNFN
jgi:hypothetical protein